MLALGNIVLLSLGNVRHNSSRILVRRKKVSVTRQEGVVTKGVSTKRAATGGATTEISMEKKE